MIVFPVRIIMSPTSSSIPLAGTKARSATVRTTQLPWLTASKVMRRPVSGTNDNRGWDPEPGGTLARAMRLGCVALALAGVLATGCGSERQEEDGPEGEFTLEIVEASFPARQSAAQRA